MCKWCDVVVAFFLRGRGGDLIACIDCARKVAIFDNYFHVPRFFVREDLIQVQAAAFAKLGEVDTLIFCLRFNAHTAFVRVIFVAVFVFIILEGIQQNRGITFADAFILRDEGNRMRRDMRICAEAEQIFALRFGNKNFAAYFDIYHRAVFFAVGVFFFNPQPANGHIARFGVDAEGPNGECAFEKNIACEDVAVFRPQGDIALNNSVALRDVAFFGVKGHVATLIFDHAFDEHAAFFVDFDGEISICCALRGIAEGDIARDGDVARLRGDKHITCRGGDIACCDNIASLCRDCNIVCSCDIAIDLHIACAVFVGIVGGDKNIIACD